MNNLSDRKKAKVGEEQKLHLVEFLEQNPQLKSGKFTNTFTYKTSQKCWKDIALQLNAVGPVQKDWKQWRKTWQDIKSKTKAKSAEIKKHRQGTGGGEPIKDLTASEERILNVIGEVAVSGQPNTSSSSVEFNEMEVTVIHDHEYYCSALESPKTVNSNVAEINLLVEGDTVISENENKILHCIFKKPSAAKELELNEPHTEVTGGKKVKNKQRKTTRLDNSIRASEKFAEQTATKLEIKQNYVNAKLKYFQAKIEVENRIAAALEKIAEAMN